MDAEKVLKIAMAGNAACLTEEAFVDALAELGRLKQPVTESRDAELIRLRAENRKLREAVEKVASGDWDRTYCILRARAALQRKGASDDRT